MNDYTNRDSHTPMLVSRQAAEIDRLRRALKSIAANTCCDRCQEAALVARAALAVAAVQPSPQVVVQDDERSRNVNTEGK